MASLLYLLPLDGAAIPVRGDTNRGRRVKLDVDLKAYYERKVAEGKNKMSVLNAVKNKLLARVVACVNNNKEYVNKAA